MLLLISGFNNFSKFQHRLMPQNDLLECLVDSPRLGLPMELVVCPRRAEALLQRRQNEVVLRREQVVLVGITCDQAPPNLS
jgi:hypothetical protein